MKKRPPNEFGSLLIQADINAFVADNEYGLVKLFRRSYFDLHKATESANALDPDLGAGDGRDHAAHWVGRIVVAEAIVEHRIGRLAREMSWFATEVQRDGIRRFAAEGGVERLDSISQ